MKATTIEARLLAEGCNRNKFSVGLADMRSDTFCLAFVEGSWQIFYSERGRRNRPLFESSSEQEACQYFFDKIMKIRHLHLVGLFEDAEEAQQFQAELAEHQIETQRNDMPPMRAGTAPVKRVFVVGKAIFAVQELYTELPVKGTMTAPTQTKPVAVAKVAAVADPSLRPAPKVPKPAPNKYRFSVTPDDDKVFSAEEFTEQLDTLNQQIQQHQGDNCTIEQLTLSDVQRRFLSQLFSGPLEAIMQKTHAEIADFYAEEPKHVRFLTMHVHQLTLPEQADGDWKVTVGEASWGDTLVLFSLTGWQVTERVLVG